MLDPKQVATIEATARRYEKLLKENFCPNFGIFPSAQSNSNFFNQVYARDSAHAICSYFAEAHPEAAECSLATLFKFQREDGAIPLRVEREFQLIKLTPGLNRFSKQIFDLVQLRLKGEKEHPVFEGGDCGVSGAEDTIPLVLIAAGEFFNSSPKGRSFGQSQFVRFQHATAFFQTKIDPSDGLAVITRMNPDWADSLNRKGKLGGINVWWARSLKAMEFMAKSIGRDKDAKRFHEDFRRTKQSILEKLYAPEGYFRAKEGDNRIDTVASIFGILYLLSPVEAVKVVKTLDGRVRKTTGLQNFEPPYPAGDIAPSHRAWGFLAYIKQAATGKEESGMEDYHNRFIWPWVTCQSIQVKIKIATGHPEENIRAEFKGEALKDLAQVSDSLQKAGGPYEILDPDEARPARIVAYTPQSNFLGTMAAYQGVYRRAKRLGWL